MNIQTINQSIQSQKKQLLNHSLYNKVKKIDNLHFYFCSVQIQNQKKLEFRM